MSIELVRAAAARLQELVGGRPVSLGYVRVFIGCLQDGDTVRTHVVSHSQLGPVGFRFTCLRPPQH